MKISIIILLTCLIAFTCTSHILMKFKNQFDRLVQAYQRGDTSLSFSIGMKIYFALEAFKEESEIESPSFQFSIEGKTCEGIMQEVVGMLQNSDWIEQYQQVTVRFQFLQKQCTNSDFKSLGKSANGFDNECALCVVILRVMENYISYHSKNAADFIQKQVCNLFDGIMKPTCEAFIHYAGPTIIRSILNKETADVICLKLGMCKNPKCRITESWKSLRDFENVQEIPSLREMQEEQLRELVAPWDWLVHIFVDKFGNGHLPPFDLDNDTFSDISTFRGYNWRGADCNELNSKVYPGRKTGTDIIDHDCNGIYGLTLKGKSFEQTFCSEEKTKSKRLGLVVIGDSAGAHFSIPEKYFNASMIKKGTYDDLLARVANQLDIPQESGYTGHINTTYQSHSVYKYMREWNLCNNNDYQNAGVNGGDAGNTWGNIHAVKRDQKNDYPLLMFLELIGNDVCKKSFESMTKPQQFRKSILKLLNWLDTQVPAGSHLLILGLGDGELLYDNLHDSIHPLNVTYSKVYDFLNCLDISPCWSWLNSNETVRHFATKRAVELSKVYQQIIDDGIKFNNFDMVYYDFPAMEILERKVRQGGDPKDMIERCDGFHPNVEFNSYLADWLWFKIQTQHISWVGQKNPFNEQIRKQFGIPIIV